VLIFVTIHNSQYSHNFRKIRNLDSSLKCLTCIQKTAGSISGANIYILQLNLLRSCEFSYHDINLLRIKICYSSKDDQNIDVTLYGLRNYFLPILLKTHQRGRGVKLTTHLHLVPRSKNAWSYTPHSPNTPSWHGA
jgi:hypothetical protein